MLKTQQIIEQEQEAKEIYVYGKTTFQRDLHSGKETYAKKPMEK